MPSPRRALVVAYDFPPHAAIGTMRTLRVVRRLIEEEWDVTVLTGDPRTFRRGTPVDNALLNRVPDRVRIVRAPTLRGFERLKRVVRRTPAPTGTSSPPEPAARMQAPAAPAKRSLFARAIDVVDGALAIPDSESGWLAPAVTAGLRAGWSDRPDVLYSSAPPWTGQLVACALASALRVPWVADFRDPWSRAPWREDRFRFAMRAAAHLERIVVRRTDHIVFVAEGNRDDFAAAYPHLASRFHVIANGCDPSEFDALQRHARQADDTFVLLHAGSLYAGRTPLPLLRALATAIGRGVVDPQRFRLRFLGTAALPSGDLAGLCRSLGLEQVVEFLPRVEREASLRAMVDASALLLLQPGHTVAVPGKLYEYLAAGRPILTIADGETAALASQSGLGISVGPDDEAAMIAALESLVRNAGHEPPAAPRALYDGLRRAAQTTAILAAVARGDRLPAAMTNPELYVEQEVSPS